MEFFAVNYFNKKVSSKTLDSRSGSRAAATSKMGRFVIIVNGFQPLTIIKKRSILDVAAALNPPLKLKEEMQDKVYKREETWHRRSGASTIL